MDGELAHILDDGDLEMYPLLFGHHGWEGRGGGWTVVADTRLKTAAELLQ